MKKVRAIVTLGRKQEETAMGCPEICVGITCFQSVLEGESFAGVSLVGVKDQFYC